MFWWTSESRGADPREQSNAGQLDVQRQQVWTRLPASLLSELFCDLTWNQKSEREVRGGSLLPPVVSPFHLLKKVRRDCPCSLILFSTKLRTGTDFRGFNPIDKTLFFPPPFSFGLFLSKWLWEATPFLGLLKQHQRAGVFFLPLQTLIYYMFKSQTTGISGKKGHLLQEPWHMSYWEKHAPDGFSLPEPSHLSLTRGKDVEHGKNLGCHFAPS